MPSGPRLLETFGGIQSNPAVKPTGPVVVDWDRAPRGLLCFMLNDPNGIGDLVTGQMATVVNVAFTSTVAGSAFDPRAGSALNAGAYVRLGSQLPVKFSSECYFRAPPSFTPGVNTPLTTGCNSLGGGQFDRTLYIDGTDQKVKFFIYTGSVRQATGSALTANEIYHVVGTSDGTSVRIYVNGVLIDTQAGGNADTGYTTPGFAQGYSRVTGNGNIEMTSKVIHCCLSNTVWNDQEVLDRYLNPYDFLIPAENVMPAVFAASGPTTVSGVGSATGIGTATGIGASAFTAVASSNGVGTATGIGSSTSAGSAVGSATGIATALAVGRSTSAAIASANGVGAATGISLSLGPVAAVASSSGTGTALGISPALIPPLVPRLRLKGSRVGVFRIS